MRATLEDLENNRERAGIFLDFDGTLSDIVAVPSEARPHEGAVDVLRQLAARYAAVTIVSGRSAEELLHWLGPGIDIWGVHGAQRVQDGEVVVSPVARPYRDLMRRVFDEAQTAVGELGLTGVVVEDKAVMIGLHFRAASDPEVAARLLDDVAARLADRHGLWRAGGRLAFELRPPVELSKEIVVLEVAREADLEAALFAGDDRVDLPGFDALDRLERAGARTLRVAVASEEAPPELIERADLTVDGPIGLIELLRRLL